MEEMQALMQRAREMLASQGAPVTTENLNRAMLMLTGSGDVRTEQTAEGFDMNAQVDRVMQRSTGRPGTRANVPRNAQPNTPVGTTGAAGTAPDENAVPDMTLPMPPPDVAAAATEAGQQPTIIPGEGMMYTPMNAPPSELDGNGMSNRFWRDALMGAEAAGAVSGTMPQVGAVYTNASRALPNIRLGMNRPQIAGPGGSSAAQLGDDAAGAAVTGTPRPALPGPNGAQAQLPAPQQALPAPQAAAPATPPSLSPAQQRAVAGPDLPPGTPSGLTPRQRATLMGPGQAGDAAFKAARVREGGPRGVGSAAQRQRASNRSNASN